MTAPLFMPLALGLVGVGKIARDQHLPAIAGEQGIRLVAMASRHADDRKEVRFAELGEMLVAESDIAAVSLASPPVGRSQTAREALRANKHVMLEKPPCATLGEALALRQLARERSLTLFASWHSREAPAVEIARAWLANRRIVSGRIAWREDVRIWHPGQEWIFEAGGMGVFDPGINALSILTAILPGTVTLERATLDYPANRQSPIRAELDLRHDFEATIAADFDFLHDDVPEWSIAIDTDSGLARIDQGGARLWLDGVPIPLEPSREYSRLYRKFVELIAQGRSDIDLAPLSLVADAMLIADRRISEPFHF